MAKHEAKQARPAVRLGRLITRRVRPAVTRALEAGWQAEAPPSLAELTGELARLVGAQVAAGEERVADALQGRAATDPRVREAILARKDASVPAIRAALAAAGTPASGACIRRVLKAAGVTPPRGAPPPVIVRAPRTPEEAAAVEAALRAALAQLGPPLETPAAPPEAPQPETTPKKGKGKGKGTPW